MLEGEVNQVSYDVVVILPLWGRLCKELIQTSLIGTSMLHIIETVSLLGTVGSVSVS